MEVGPKVHRHRHRRSDTRQRFRNERFANNLPERTIIQDQPDIQQSSDDIVAAEEGCAALNSSRRTSQNNSVTSVSQENEKSQSGDSLENVGNSSGNSQQTVVLVNGHEPPQDQQTFDDLNTESPQDIEGPSEEKESSHIEINIPECASETNEVNDLKINAANVVYSLESPTQAGHASSRNSSGDAMSLRETLQQLPSTITGMHRHRRAHSPQSPKSRALEVDSSFHRGILGLMDNDYKQPSPTPSTTGANGGLSTLSASNTRKMQSLSDPQASPAQRSLRSRSSLDKSPRRKRSKSESRRRRERKLIAAGEMEVRQANETLMRYLKQCSEMNDASLSGELEIDQSFEERRVHRKTKSQRDKRGHLISKLYTAGGLSSILKELSDDIVPAEGEEIYNPFTPVVSPTDDTPAHIDKMFLQTSSGYRPVEHCYYKHSFLRTYRGHRNNGTTRDTIASEHSNGTCNGAGLNDATAGSIGLRPCGSYGDTRCLLDAAEFNQQEISTKIEMACFFQRFWILISNICHGLLAGLALAHLLFVLSSHPMDWTKLIKAANEVVINNPNIDQTTNSLNTINDNAKEFVPSKETIDTNNIRTATNDLISEYATFAEIYLNTFFVLTIICLVSVFDRMDICRIDLSNASELISFRWVIISMIYIATMILTICSDSIDEKLYVFTNNTNQTLSRNELLSNSVLSVWSSLSITRSIGAVCGWIMIGFTPHEDLLYEHLLDLTKYQLPSH